MTAQFIDLERALIGQGNFKLTSNYNTFSLPRSTWINMNDKAQDNHKRRFLKTILPFNKRTVISTDGQLTMLRSAFHAHHFSILRDIIELEPILSHKGLQVVYVLTNRL